MKKVLVVFLMAVGALIADAQITWNAKAGIGIANCWGEESSGSHFVGKIGAGIEKPFTSNWSLMPSLEIAWKGAQESYEYDNGYSLEKFKATLDILYLQIPVLAAYRLNLNDSWNMTFKAGPYLAFALWGEMREDGEHFNIFKKEDEYNGANRFDLGLDLGIDFEYHRFVFGVEYEVGFISIDKEYSLRNSAAYLTVGYKF